jgi:sulfopropanediol 3-dehydrogenase
LRPDRRLSRQGVAGDGRRAGRVSAGAVDTNYILPTGRRARYTGGVWVGTYLKTLTHQELSDEGAARTADLAARLRDFEGVSAYEPSARRRLTDE